MHLHGWTAKQSQGDYDMTTKALLVRLEAKPGKENEVAKFLRDGQGLVQQEPATTAWFGIQLGPTTFAIFDAFPDEAGRNAPQRPCVSESVAAAVFSILATFSDSSLAAAIASEKGPWG